jgi:hypothetical protein
MKISEVIAELRNLNEPVPVPARLPTESEVASAEQQLGVRFPADYRHFLLHASDIAYGAVEPALVTPNAGHLNLMQVATDAWEAGVPKEWLPFCESNGDYYCLRAEGRVIYWSHQGAVNETWQGLAHWIRQVWIESEN